MTHRALDSEMTLKKLGPGSGCESQGSEVYGGCLSLTFGLARALQMQHVAMLHRCESLLPQRLEDASQPTRSLRSATTRNNL